jgi:hypothetical protein
VAERLAQHKIEPAVSHCANVGLPLLVTWASVMPDLADGAERYLVDLYRPALEQAPAAATPLAINLPFAAPRTPSGRRNGADQRARRPTAAAAWRGQR